LYAYKAGILADLTSLPPGKLEQVEHLEQLRWLEAGYGIVVTRANSSVPAGVDTEADLAAVEAILDSQEAE